MPIRKRFERIFVEEAIRSLGRGILREVLMVCTQQDFTVSGVRIERESSPGASNSDEAAEQSDLARSNAERRRIVTVALEILGTRSVAKLASKLAEINGVVSVNAGDANIATD